MDVLRRLEQRPLHSERHVGPVGFSVTRLDPGTAGLSCNGGPQKVVERGSGQSRFAL